jgi:hypothetical protein
LWIFFILRSTTPRGPVFLGRETFYHLIKHFPSLSISLPYQRKTISHFSIWSKMARGILSAHIEKMEIQETIDLITTTLDP